MNQHVLSAISCHESLAESNRWRRGGKAGTLRARKWDIHDSVSPAFAISGLIQMNLTRSKSIQWVNLNRHNRHRVEFATLTVGRDERQNHQGQNYGAQLDHRGMEAPQRSLAVIEAVNYSKPKNKQF